MHIGFWPESQKERTIQIWTRDNIKMNLRNVGLGDTDDIDLALNKDQHDGLLNTVMNLRVS